MPTSPAPINPASRLQWLVDRAQISDLLVEFARALDARDGHHHATGAGWYDNTLSRTDAGWRLSSVRLQMVWRVGDGPLPGERPH